MRGDAGEADVGGADEGGERGERVGDAGEGRVSIDARAAERRRLAAVEPLFEVDVRDLEPAGAALGLGVDATDEVWKCCREWMASAPVIHR